MAEDELKNLPPEERIRKLKELEKKRKKEIEEARQKIQESEKELADQEEWGRRVPIPQVAAEEMGGMSEAEKEILEAHKNLKERKRKTTEEGAAEEVIGEKRGGLSREGKERQNEEDLERTVLRERTELPPEVLQSEYAEKLSRTAMEDIYRRMMGLSEEIKEKGYVSPEEQREIQYITAATERKMEDARAGSYSLTERVAEEAQLTRRVGSSLMGMYKQAGYQG